LRSCVAELFAAAGNRAVQAAPARLAVEREAAAEVAARKADDEAQAMLAALVEQLHKALAVANMA
jgi:hypothetical protein